MLEENSVGASVEESIEQSKKIANVINHLIQKENVLMIAQDAKIKNERYLCLNVNLDLQNMNLGEWLYIFVIKISSFNRSIIFYFL